MLVMPLGINMLTVIHKVYIPFSVKLIHALQRLNELQDLIPLAIEHQLPVSKMVLNIQVIIYGVHVIMYLSI